MHRPIRRLRWWIGGLLFLSTVINYIDRQTLAVLGPYLQKENGWNNSDFATILIAFRVAYTIGQAVCGRLLDLLGTGRGLSLSVAFYSAVACLTAFAQGINGFRFFRALLGFGESANWPGAAKAVSEWFPPKERGWAVALYDSGSAVGGALAPLIVLAAYGYFGSWRPVFVVTGALGFVWLIAWRALYRAPESHPRLAPEEWKTILAGRAPEPRTEPVSWRGLLRYRQTWGIVISRSLIDPYWFLISEWFAIYLVSKGFRMEESVLGFWAPFLGADLGNFCGGALSSWWIRRGWSVGRARRTTFLIFGPGMLLMLPTAFTSNYWAIVLLSACAVFAYAACATIALAAPADVFESRAVASVSGLSGTGAGIGTLISTYLIGYVADRFSFQPVMVVGSIIPVLATFVFVTMVRRSEKADPEKVLADF